MSGTLMDKFRSEPTLGDAGTVLGATRTSPDGPPVDRVLVGRCVYSVCRLEGGRCGFAAQVLQVN